MSLQIASFGLQLYSQLVKLGGGAGQAGYFISPLSAYLALILALNGAGPLSQTQRELWFLLTQRQLPSTLPNVTTAEAALNSQTSSLQKGLLGQSSSNGTQILIANALWTNKTTLRQQYTKNMMTLFQAPVTAVTSAAPINSWADKSTKGLIKRVVPDDARFNAVITNAVYFKGLWEFPFTKSNTRQQRFRLGPNSTVQVDMMFESFNEGVQYAVTPGAFRAVKLPYQGSDIVAIAVLPDERKYGFNVDAALADVGISRLLDADWEDASLAEPSLRVSMPKFKVKLDMLPVGKALQALGVKEPFSSRLADFSRMSEDELYITDVLQSVVVIVDESGTEAAAVTTILARTTAFIPGRITEPLVFDRPFIFLIVDESSKAVLFMGTVRDPSKEQ